MDTTEKHEDMARPFETRKRRGLLRGSLFWPLLLIAIGILILLRNTGSWQGDVASIILTYWPVLFIVSALDELLQGKGIIGPGFWLAAGILLLLANLNRVPWDTWALIVNLWPLMLVTFGVELLFGRRSWMMGLLGLLVVMAFLAAGLWILVPGNIGSQIEAVQPLEGAEEVDLQLEPVVGSIEIGSLSDPQGDTFFTGQYLTSENFRVEQDYQVQNGKGELRLERSMIVFPGSALNWDLKFSPAVTYILNTDMAIGFLDYDLSGLRIAGMDLNVPVGGVDVTLPETSSFSGRINVPMGSVTITVPEGVGFKLEKEGGLVAVDVPDDYSESGNEYTSPGYADAEYQVDLSVNTGMGIIVVKED